MRAELKYDDTEKRNFPYLQACGIINDHTEGCFRYQDIVEHYPVIRKRKDKEE